MKHLKTCCLSTVSCPSPNPEYTAIRRQISLSWALCLRCLSPVLTIRNSGSHWNHMNASFRLGGSQLVSGSSNIMLMWLIFIYIFIYRFRFMYVHIHISTYPHMLQPALLKKLKTSVKIMQAFIELTTDHHAYRYHSPQGSTHKDDHSTSHPTRPQKLNIDTKKWLYLKVDTFSAQSFCISISILVVRGVSQAGQKYSARHWYNSWRESSRKTRCTFGEVS